MMHDQISDTTSKTLTKRKGDKLDTGKVIKKSKHCRASKAKWSPEEVLISLSLSSLVSPTLDCVVCFNIAFLKDDILARAVMVAGEGNWKKIAQSLNDRSHLQCLHRWQKVLNPALVKGPWKEEVCSITGRPTRAKYTRNEWLTLDCRKMLS